MVLVDVAVPVPIHAALTYSVPDEWRQLAVAGSRVRVQVGKRRLTGIVLGEVERPPAGVTVRAIDEVVDLTPTLPPDLLSLARFVADYYLEPIGEVVRSMLPAELPSWGARRVALTSAGALARPRTAVEQRLVELLLERGRMTVAELQAQLEANDLPRTLERLRDEGRVSVEATVQSGQRYVSAVELPEGDREHQLKACGRSPQARAVVEFLDVLARPATLHEVRETVGCSEGVVRRLIRLGVLRQFTQIERLSLDRHLLGRGERRGSAGERPVLRADQQAAVRAMGNALAEHRFAPFLLAGVTGSGKTEVYLRAVEETLAAGRSAILLVPEIALVPALAAAARSRFGERLAILHSALGRSEREQEWERIRGGEARVVLGPRSALWAPVSELGLVVVDEEQDASYKQETTPRYHGRDLAVVRAQRASAVVVLVSATPSVETRFNVERRRYGLLALTQRVGQGSLPEGILVDLRQERAARVPGEVHFSARLCEEITRALDDDDQIILLRNRRGYAPLYLCRACGEDLRCEDCGLPRTYHRREGKLICHYCGSLLGKPARCPQCGEDAMEPIGAGTERVEEELRERFPEAKVGVLDRDSVRRRGGVAAVLEAFRTGRTRILVGTQMVSKGHHFPNVALTAVLAADSYLAFPDFRAVERTYSMLTQLAGRAGRGDRPGRVVIQTFHPDHYAIRAALEHDDASFAAEEMRFRRIFHYPPYSRMIQLLLRDRNRERGAERIATLAATLERHPLAAGVRILGPAPAPLEKLRGYWRFQLLLRGSSGKSLRRMVKEVAADQAGPSLVIDVDPQDLL